MTAPEQIFDRLLEIALLIQEDLAASFAGTGLTAARTHLLWVLHHSGPSNQQTLAAALSVSPRNVTGLVDALEAGGFVERRPHPSDRRATLVTLTEPGTEIMTQMAGDRQAIASSAGRGLRRGPPRSVGHRPGHHCRPAAGNGGRGPPDPGADMQRHHARHPATGWRRVGNLARRAWAMEISGYQNLFRFVFRRPRVPTGWAGFSYHQPVLSVMIVFTVLSVVELVVVDVVVRRWPAVRLPLLVLGIWGVTFLLGLLFGMLVRPHAVGPDGIRIRSGPEIDIPLTWDDIGSVTRRTRTVPDRQPKVTVDGQGEATLHLRMMNETNLDIRLARSTPLRLPGGSETVSVVAVHADDPKGFLAEVDRYL